MATAAHILDRYESRWCPPAMLGKRQANHAAIRADGFGEKLDRLIAMLASHSAKLAEVERLAATATGPAAFILGMKAKEAKSALAAIEATLDAPEISDSPYGSLGWWGPNGRGPAIDDLLRSARFHAGAPVGVGL